MELTGDGGEYVDLDKSTVAQLRASRQLNIDQAESNMRKAQMKQEILSACKMAGLGEDDFIKPILDDMVEVRKESIVLEE